MNVLYYKFGHSQATLYFYAYWTQSALSDLLSFAVFYELFCAAFKPFAGLRDMAQVVFHWVAVALLLIGIVIFFSSSHPSMQRVSEVVVNIERSICVMQCALLLFLFIGSTYLGLSKRSYIFGISLGFGIASASSMILVSLISMFGAAFTKSLFGNALHAITAMGVPLIWAIYLAKPEPARETVNVPITSPLIRWNEVAMALGHSGGRVAFMDNPEPFMPRVERMVEEIMNKDMKEFKRG